MEIFYAVITTNLIFRKIKYEIGKRYQLINGKEIFHKWKDIDINNISGKLSIYLVRVDQKNNYFKILKEINYSKFLKSKDKKENLISALKNRDEWSLQKFSDIDNISQIVNAYIKNENYLNNLIKNNNTVYWCDFIIKYLHNKYLDYLVDNDDSLNDDDNIQIIASLGIHKYLDKIFKKNKYFNPFEICSALKNGRKRDIKKYIDNDNYIDIIVSTKIDDYLDKFVTNENTNISYIIAQIGRKKDLDILVQSKSEKIRSTVAYHGYDEHLDMLVNDKSKLVLQSVLDIGRNKDIDILRKSPIANELNFPKAK